MSEIDGAAPDDRASAMWAHASRMLSAKGNKLEGGDYGWATLRAVALHGLAMQGLRESSEDAAVQLLSLMAEISPAKKKSKKQESSGTFFSHKDDSFSVESSVSLKSSPDTASYLASESVVSVARSYVRDRIRAQGTSFFSGTETPSTLTVAQSRWADDDPIPPILVPMADFSEISMSIIAMRSVWSAIKLDHLSKAQKKLIGQISDLRKNMPASSLPRNSSESNSSFFPIKITSVVIVDSEPHAGFERVKAKRPQEDLGAMATFFNPYANKKGEAEATIVPEGEERYVLVRFANSLAVPMEIPRCQLEFNVPQSDRIKAPAISFVIPGQIKDFPVQFPFNILKGRGEKGSGEQDSNTFEIKGLHLTCLTRSIFLPLKGSGDTVEQSSEEAKNIPDAASLYPRRNYGGKKAEKDKDIRSPRLELIPPQPNLLISFATSPTPIEEDTIIPTPLADGETFTLPKLCLFNDPGLSGLGKIEQLRITAVGLPGHSEIALFDLHGIPEKEEVKGNVRAKKVKATPLELTAQCNGIDDETLNGGKKSGKSSITLQLSAKPDMGAHTKECTVTIRFRYRGKAPSAAVEFWRKREVQVRVLRIKGPRISSLTFRPDLAWESAYSQLCATLSHQDKHKRYRPTRMNELDIPQTGSTDIEDFVINRFGKDPGVHACGDKVVLLVSVANETTSAITLSKPTGVVGGFECSPLETMRVPPGVSAKIPMIVPRVDRAPEICERLTEMTSFEWKSEIPEQQSEASIETGGTMVPVNRRIRRGKIGIQPGCLKSIIDENPTFLSRICKAPCSVNIGIVGEDDKEEVDVELGKPVDTSVEIDLADWIPPEVLKQSNYSLEFCCARKATDGKTEKQRDYVWCGQIRKTLPKEGKKHTHRARIIFLREGEYVVSACVSFSRTDIDDDVKEIWWAQNARHVRVQDRLLSQ